MLMQSMHASQDALWVAELAAAVVADSQPGNLSQRLEESLRRALPLRAVELAKVSEGTPIAPARVDATHVSLRVASAHGPYVLRVSFRPGYAADHTALSRLHLAASLASLVLEIERGRRMTARPLAANTEGGSHGPLVGASEPMNELSRLIDRVAKNDFIVLVEGESGSGKELVARRIHELSRRRRGPFVAVNCAALVETLFEAELFGIEDRTATGVRGRRGKFEVADTGTLFLDEVSDLSSVAQAKLLRAIQELTVERVGSHDPRRVDVRIVVATNRSLATLVAAGRFRADLFHRLNGVEVMVPPLRARAGDVPRLATHFLARHRAPRPYRLSVEALDALGAYHWPGNVRELERVLERAVTLAERDEIRLEDLPAALRHPYAERLLPSLTRPDDLRTWASRYVRLVLARQDGNKRRACRALGISYHTLQAYLRRTQERPSAGGRRTVGRLGPAAVAETPAPAWPAEREEGL